VVVGAARYSERQRHAHRNLSKNHAECWLDMAAGRWAIAGCWLLVEGGRYYAHRRIRSKRAVASDCEERERRQRQGGGVFSARSAGTRTPRLRWALTPSAALYLLLCFQASSKQPARGDACELGGRRTIFPHGRSSAI
jgi:hypothetical protein